MVETHIYFDDESQIRLSIGAKTVASWLRDRAGCYEAVLAVTLQADLPTHACCIAL